MESRKPEMDSDHPAAIRIENLGKKIAGKQVLQDITLSVPKGRVMAICGPNGAGKTTLIRVLLGLLAADRGRVQVNAPLERCAFVFHSSCLFADLTLRQNCRFFLSSKKQAARDRELNELQAEFGLGSHRDARVGTFSRGLMQKADLVRALLEKPDILFLDEPTANLDPLGKVDVRKILRRRVESGMTLLLTSHLLGEVEKLADRVCILQHGRVIWEGDPSRDLRGGDLESRFIELVGASKEDEHE